MSLRVDEDSLAGVASATLAIAVNAAKQIENDEALTRRATDMEGLLEWRESPDAWRAHLAIACDPYRLPAKSEMESRTLAQSMFNRVCMNVEAASDPRLEQAARHRSLMQAGLFCGVLYAAANNVDGLDAALKEMNSQQASTANMHRLKVQAMLAVKAKFKEWREEPGKQKEWHLFKDFGRWAADTYDLDAAYVARKAGQWERERSAAISAGRVWP